MDIKNIVDLAAQIEQELHAGLLLRDELIKVVADARSRLAACQEQVTTARAMLRALNEAVSRSAPKLADAPPILKVADAPPVLQPLTPLDKNDAPNPP